MYKHALKLFCLYFASLMLFSDIKNAFILVINRPYKMVINFDRNIKKVFCFYAMRSHAFALDKSKNLVFLVKIYICHLLTITISIINHKKLLKLL